MSAMDEQEEENNKKCEIRQNSDSHRQLNFQKLTCMQSSLFFYQIAPHDKQIIQIPDGCKNVFWIIHETNLPIWTQ